jgi:hypothetical protein
LPYRLAGNARQERALQPSVKIYPLSIDLHCGYIKRSYFLYTVATTFSDGDSPFAFRQSTGAALGYTRPPLVKPADVVMLTQ